MRRNLEYRGSSTSLFGPILLTALLGTLTLGIYIPWGICRLRRRILENTYFGERPLQFDGTGGQLFGLMLKNLLLTLITLGIYGLLCFPIISVLKWDAEHTLLPDGTRLEYRGTALDLFGQVLIVGFLSGLTLGIYSFWGFCRIRRHILGNSMTHGAPLQFTGTGGQYFGIVIVNMLLTLVTLGIYSLLGCDSVRQLRWDCENTVLPYDPVAAPAALNPYESSSRDVHVHVHMNQ